MSTPLNPMQGQDNTDRSQIVSELKSHEASKIIADEAAVKKAQRDSEDQKLNSTQEMEERQPMDPKNEEGKEHHLPDKKKGKKKKDDEISTKAKKFMGGQFFDGFA